jgi:hypothetical protein
MKNENRTKKYPGASPEVLIGIYFVFDPKAEVLNY